MLSMNLFSIRLYVFGAVGAALMLVGCSDNSATVCRMVDEMNSAEFREAGVRSGLFEDAQAQLTDDSLVITFVCRKFLDFSVVNEEAISELRKMAVNEFRSIMNNPDFERGMSALAQEHISLVLLWEDAYGHTIELTLNPSELISTK